MLRTALIILALTTVPAVAAVDRDTAVSTLAGFYNSAQACNLFLSRAKVEAYAEANRPADDAMFNIDVWRATTALGDEQKDWTPEQLEDYCRSAADTARKLGVNLN